MWNFKNFFNKKQEEPEKEFNIGEFNDWFKNEYDGYDGRKGAPGIFLRIDKLSYNCVEQYLEYINQETNHENIKKYYEIIRKNWINYEI